MIMMGDKKMASAIGSEPQKPQEAPDALSILMEELIEAIHAKKPSDAISAFKALLAHCEPEESSEGY